MIPGESTCACVAKPAARHAALALDLAGAMAMFLVETRAAR